MNICKMKRQSLMILLFLSCFAFPMVGKQSDGIKGKSISDSRNLEGKNEFFTSGYAEVRGKIEDYTPSSKLKNFLVYFNDNLTGESKTKSVEISGDGSFIIWLPLTTPGYAKFVGDNRNFKFFLKPGQALDVAFNWKEVEEYCDRQREGEKTSKSPFKFDGELGKINQELASYEAVESVGVSNMAHDLTPNEAIRALTEDYEQRLQAVKDFAEENYIDLEARKVLEGNVKSTYIFDVFEYERTRDGLALRDTLAPSLKEPLDLQYFEPIKKLLAEDNEWILASYNMSPLPNVMAFSSLPELLGYEDHYWYDFGINALPFLKSLGVELTPEEEEINEWLGDGGRKSCTLSQLSKGNTAARLAAERHGMSEELKKFYEQHRDSNEHARQSFLVGDAVGNVKAYNEAIRKYLGVEELPVLWQVVQGEALRRRYQLNSNQYRNKEDLFEVFDEVKESGEFSNPAIIEALENSYRREYAQKSFDIPNDNRGKVIKELIEPYAGRILLLDFWDITCGPCCHAIKNSVKTREKNRSNPEFKMLFISNDESSESRYEDFVVKYLDGETCYRIQESDFHLLRDLFGFSGIPRYVLISRDGKVLDSDFSFYGMKKSLKEYGIELEGDVLEELMESK